MVLLTSASPRGRAWTKHGKVTSRTIHCFALFLSPMMMHSPAPANPRPTIHLSRSIKEYRYLQGSTGRYLQRTASARWYWHLLQAFANELFHTSSPSCSPSTLQAMHLVKKKKGSESWKLTRQRQSRGVDAGTDKDQIGLVKKVTMQCWWWQWWCWWWWRWWQIRREVGWAKSQWRWMGRYL